MEQANAAVLPYYYDINLLHYEWKMMVCQRTGNIVF